MDTLTKTKRKKGPIYTQKVMSKTEKGWGKWDRGPENQHNHKGKK